MLKGIKPENSKLTIDIPDLPPSPVGSDKSPGLSPRYTRSSQATDMDLNTLFKFIKSYDGSRETLNSFIINCNNAYELATENQKPILFKYILSQLHGKAELACSIKEFASWEQLKDFLKTQFSERKHYAHLLTDLQESRQGPQENVNQYSLRIETCLSQLLTEISLSNTKKSELAGRTAAMEDLALHHFLMGLQPRISSIVRCRSPRNLNEAINLAISEERIQQTVYRRNQTDNKPRMQTQTQFRQNQYRPPQRLSNTYQTQQTPNSSQQMSLSNVTCRYCKNIGHTIENCRKRQYNNSRRSDFNQHQQSSNNLQRRNQPIHYVPETQESDLNDIDNLNEQAFLPSIVREN